MQATTNLSVDCRDPKAFRIFGSSLFPTLLPYCVQDMSAEEAVYGAGYVDLLGIIRVFRRSIQHGPSVFVDKLDKRVIGSNETKKKLISSLIFLGIVARDGVHYRLDLEKLGSHGISMSDILAGNPTKNIASFIRMLLSLQ